MKENRPTRQQVIDHLNYKFNFWGSSIFFRASESAYGIEVYLNSKMLLPIPLDGNHYSTDFHNYLARALDGIDIETPVSFNNTGHVFYCWIDNQNCAWTKE